MTDRNTDRSVSIEPNSKPILLKRFISTGFDTVSLLLVFLLLTYIIMQTPLASAYNTHADNCRKTEEAVLREYGNDLEKARERLNADAVYRDELFAANLHGYLLKALARGLREGVLFLIIPLSNESRGTLGRLATGIGLFNELTQTYARWYQVVGRFIFIFVFESMTLYLGTGILTFLLVPVIRFIMIMLNKKNKTLCDYMTSTMLIEKLSYSSIR